VNSGYSFIIAANLPPDHRKNAGSETPIRSKYSNTNAPHLADVHFWPVDGLYEQLLDSGIPSTFQLLPLRITKCKWQLFFHLVNNLESYCIHASIGFDHAVPGITEHSASQGSQPEKPCPIGL
jgi:hypothetical protein